MGRAGAGRRDVCRPATVCYWVSCLVLSFLFKDTVVILQHFGPQSQSLHSTRGICFGCSLNIFFNLHMRGAHICVGVGTHIRRLGEDVECLYCPSPSSLRQGLSLSLELSSACLSRLARSPCLHLSILAHARQFYMSSGIWTRVLLLSQQTHLSHWAISLGWQFWFHAHTLSL